MDKTKQAEQNQKKLNDQTNRITALKKLMVYYREITETVREPFVILDKDLCVVTANLAFYNTFQVKKQDTEERRIYDLGDNQWNAPELKELLEHILPTHKIMNGYEVTHVFPSIGLRTILLNARQIDSKQLILLAMEDITEWRRLQNDAAEVTANLIQQQDNLKRLSDSKDEFVAMASHQLRTPATAVKLYVGMALDGYAGNLAEDQKNLLHIAYKNNERQLEIIEDLLRVAKVDDGKVYLHKSSCDIVQQVEVVIKEQAVLFESRGQSVVLNIPEASVVAMIDPKLMRMVLENLLDNAGKYSPNGSVVTIDIFEDAEQAVVAIADQGVGILAVDQPKLFKKFSRIENSLSESVKGTGLGLYWAKKILDLHKGSIEVSSKLNEGTTFTVKTPIAAHAGIPENDSLGLPAA